MKYTSAVTMWQLTKDQRVFIVKHCVEKFWTGNSIIP